MLKTIRTSLAIVVFIGITLLFLDFTGTLHHWLSWLAKIQFLPAVMALNVIVIAALVVLTLVFGRIYCSVICPLGILQDLLARLRRKKNKYSYSKEVRWLRYPVLVVFIVAAVAGVGSLFQLLAPYSSFGRIATMLFQPLWMMGNNVLGFLAERADSYAFYTVDVWMKSLPVFIVALVTLVVLVVTAWTGGRTYCNTICPVGTILSFLARFSWLKVRFDAEKCKNCTMCSRNCKSSCIDYKTHTVDYSRCVVCGNCISKCKFGALKYSGKIGKTDRAAESSEPADSAKRCTGCQLCVSECPNGVLRPSNDLMHLMLPVMSYEHGFCRPECTRCSEVCPAGAIKLVDQAEKSSIQIGHAVFVQKNCVAVTDGVECGNCERHCPTGAIEMVALREDDDESPWVPSVNEEACIGCGACEYVCPARPFSAIMVEGHEVHRSI